MLLKSLELNNIRSYTNQTITFPEGSTILAGDIGSGKSSILLAIEFALFGTSRPDLPAELLLRKGKINASVELTFKLKDQEITINRKLKKERDTIKQSAGFIIKNGIKKDLLPGELKSEILTLLGYPEDLLTKNKNYLFRYTIYTPQEEMKFILQENAETRLDTLRKIFNTDKYKIIRENTQHILKQMRTSIAVLKTRTEPFEEKKNELKQLKEESQLLEQQIVPLTPKIAILKEKIKIKNEEIGQHEANVKQFQDKRQQHTKLRTQLKSNQDQLQSLKNKQNDSILQISSLNLPQNLSKENIQSELQILEQQKTTILQDKTSLEHKIKQFQHTITSTQQEIQVIQQQLSLLPGKQEQISLITTELENKPLLQSNLTQIEELFYQTSQLITKNETILNQSQELHSKITSLQNCPMCLQDVTNSHKEKISQEENNKINQAQSLLTNFKSKLLEITTQKTEISNKIIQLQVKENLLTKLNTELLQLQIHQQTLNQKKDLLKQAAQENNSVMQQLFTINQENKLESLQSIIQQNQNQLQKINQYALLSLQLTQIKTDSENLTIQSQMTQSSLNELELSLQKFQDPSLLISQLRNEMQELSQNERTLSIQHATLTTNLTNITKNTEKLILEIKLFTEMQTQLIKFKEIYRWLDSFFLKLTYTIEKQIMANIHHIFNELFQDWFSTLIDDDQIYARIDDSFSPMIIQNGHEISFNNLSGGEKTSAALAYRLALNKVINDVIHQINTKDLLILDEPTDGFSTEQLDKVRDVLDKLNLKQTIIVSHETKIESFVENILRIKKENHVSSIQ